MKPEHRKDLYLHGLCFITDRDSCRLSCLEMAGIALDCGVRWIQYRDKGRSRLGLFRTAYRLRQLTRRYDAFLIVNDYADIAASVDADGVHLGQEDLPVGEARKVMGAGKIVGVSTHSIAEAMRAEAEGADYIGFGPVFPTRTKAAGRPRGLDMLGEVRRAVRIPVVAIGGIGREDLEPVFGAGASAVAAASAILKGDVYGNAASFLERLDRLARA
jgi:thiamine-phosphate pyrophosphorylase